MIINGKEAIPVKLADSITNNVYKDNISQYDICKPSCEEIQPFQG